MTATAALTAARLRRLTDLGYVLESTETTADGAFVVRFHDGGGIWSRYHGYAIFRGKAKREECRFWFGTREGRDAHIINRLAQH